MRDTSDPAMTAPSGGATFDPAYLPSKVAWRLIPFLGLLYCVNILDRMNVGFARLTMRDDLGMSDKVFALGYGIFYLGYLGFEVPANLILRRVGARRWIARIMITWGLVSCATMAVTGPVSFYAVRILLGVAEAGFFPGIILYLTYWFPARERARMTALFMAAIAVAGIFGNPVSGAIMQYFNGAGGLKSWQWLFLLEGIPSVLLGIVVLIALPDGPEQARWLSLEEREWLVERVRREDHERRKHNGADLLRAAVDGRVWRLICVYFTVAVGSNAAGSIFPTLIKEGFKGVSDSQIGLLAALPHICALITMIVVGAHSDRTGERRGHVAFAAFLAAAGWTITLLSSSPWLRLAGLCMAQAGMISMLPPFWAIPASFLSGAAAAGGLAMINSVANLGGLFGPSIFERFGLGMMAAILFGGGLLALTLRQDSPRLATALLPSATDEAKLVTNLE